MVRWTGRGDGIPTKETLHENTAIRVNCFALRYRVCTNAPQAPSCCPYSSSLSSICSEVGSEDSDTSMGSHATPFLLVPEPLPLSPPASQEA
eukprot:scaffold226931_cov18-Tisochrysis_lutea.AAC.1